MSGRNWVGIWLSIACAASAGLAPSAAPGPTLNPKTYVSVSGEWRLSVDPTEMGGAGPGRYRLTRSGQEVWSGERPLTFRDAVVTDEGVVAGYGYEGGVHDTGHHGWRYSGLVVAIFDAQGDLLLRDPADTHPAGTVRQDFSGSDSPAVSGIVVDPAHDRFIVCVPKAGGGNDAATWWTYRLSDGAKTGDVAPQRPQADGGFQREVSIRLLPGTPLVLVHWYVWSRAGGGGSGGAVMSLLDPSGQAVWELQFPGEYDGLGKGWNWYRDLVERGDWQVEVAPPGFSFRSYSLAAQVRYSVAADPSSDRGWRVVETERRADQRPANPPGAAAAEAPARAGTVELVHTGTIRLQGPARAPSPIDGINRFAIDPQGRLGFVRWEEPKNARFVLADAEGKILTDTILDLPPDDQALLLHAAPTGADRWVVLRQSGVQPARTSAWWFTPATGALQEVEGFEAPGVEALSPAHDGGFLVLSRRRLEYTLQDQLSLYDGQGRRRWSDLQPGYGQGFMFQDAVCLPDGGVAALPAVKGTIEFYDAAGAHQRSLALAEVLGHRPNYPAGLAADAGGGLILHDFGGTQPVYRIDAQGALVAGLNPRFSDGRTFRLCDGVRAAPDGSLWTTDGHALLRLDADGVVDRVLGPRPDEPGLDEIRAMCVDGAGRIYALDGRTSSVHVFDSGGALLRTCRPDPTDFATDVGNGGIAVDGEGTLCFMTGGFVGGQRALGYLHFSSECRRIGFETLGIEKVVERWLFKPGSRERWVLGYRTIYLVDAERRVARTIERRPDGAWLERVHAGAVATDGSLAAISGGGDLGSAGSAVLNIYSADGEPVSSVAIGSMAIYARVAFNGTVVAISDPNGLILHDRNGAPARQAVLPGAGEQRWLETYFSPDGTELWLREVGSKTAELQRYRLP